MATKTVYAIPLKFSETIKVTCLIHDRSNFRIQSFRNIQLAAITRLHMKRRLHVVKQVTANFMSREFVYSPYYQMVHVYTANLRMLHLILIGIAKAQKLLR